MLKKHVLLHTLLILCMFTVQADVYLQSIRGSNNRLDEANRERNNGNRMFDSQNNDRGGYNVGKLNFYEDEEIPISWTNQHGCGSDDVKHCEMIIQAMCDPMMRDGTTTQRIPDNPANCRNFNCDTDVKYGRHESYAYYQECKATERNKGLFQASQNPNGNEATKTRQDPGGNRQGYECAEERDYYPYWRPSPWKDVAIFTKDTAKCAALAAESANVKSRFYCSVPQVVKEANNFGNGLGKTPNNYDACMALEDSTNDGGNITSAEWIEVPPNGWPEPVCLQSEASRPNHLGLIGNTKQWTHMWKVPQALVESGEEEMGCVFRLRYNITEDFDASQPDPVTGAFNSLDPGVVTAQYNRKQNGGGNPNNRPATLPIWTQYGITDAEVGYDPATGEIDNYNDNDLGDKRGYVMRNNDRPDVLGKEYGNDGFRLRLQLAINTAQYGRTFQDRTHVTYIKKKPAYITGDARLKLVTVAGKRGNIVQTFPGTEYFFWPETLHLRVNDYAHFGWSGSDTNPNNNDGQGKQGTDRSNIVPLKNGNYAADTVLQLAAGTTTTNHGSLGNNYPAFVKQPVGYAMAGAMSACGTAEHVQVPMAGFDEETLSALATLRRQKGAKHDYGNMEELDDAGTSFQMEPIAAAEVGCWSYVSTRNNNFSNRSQKGTLCVDQGEYAENDVGPSGAAVDGGNGWIMIPEGAMTTIQTFKYLTEDDSEVVSDNVWIEPVNMNEFLVEGQKVELGIQYEQRTLSTAVMEHRVSGDDSWQEVSDAEYNENSNGETTAVAWVDEGGWYRVNDKPNVGAIVAIVFSALVFIGVVGFMVWYQFYRNPNKSDEYSVNEGIGI